jgi:hypothetical protein
LRREIENQKGGKKIRIKKLIEGESDKNVT